ncbi:MAG: hypothetical protein KGQ37_08250 [Hyphomicrobiales bacterium]|nr:hypothetical protein [Hyphomicrobiales bacterium]
MRVSRWSGVIVAALGARRNGIVCQGRKVTTHVLQVLHGTPFSGGAS